MLNGMRIITDASLIDWIEDWSEVRSPARARRRRWRHPQRIRLVSVPKQEIYRMGDMLVCHPDILHQLEQQIGKGEAR